MAASANHLSPEEEVLIRTALSLTARLDVHDTCRAVLDAAERVYGARSSWLLLHERASGALVTLDFRGPDADVYADARIPLGDPSIVTIAFHERRPIFVGDVREERRWFDPARMRRSSMATVFTVPLLYEDEPLGVLGLDSPRFARGRPPSPADTARLQAIAAQAAIAIRNAQLFEAVEQDRRRLVRLVRERRLLRTEVESLREVISSAHPALGTSPAFRRVLDEAELVCGADSTVLLIGETGTGKELIARWIHQRSRRASQPFVAVNCAALPESLVESELFGYEKGAFTGAAARTAGKFELADRGTILLDEVGDLPPQAQSKLLRVLQEREVQRLGGARPVPVNVRVIAATNRDLEACIARGTFRSDVYYRLSVFPIALPPLRERREDIAALAQAFAARFAQREHKRTPALAPGAIARLEEYDWPGNVRELQNVIERAVILCRGAEITPGLIAVRPASIRRPSTSAATPAHAGGDDASSRAGATFADAERQAIVRALHAAGWRVSGGGGAADRLGLKPTTLHAKMKKLGIRRPGSRSGT